MEYLPYILAGCVATLLCRFLPYFLFKKRSNSKMLKYLESRSTLVIMIILMIYAKLVIILTQKEKQNMVVGVAEKKQRILC